MQMKAHRYQKLLGLLEQLPAVLTVLVAALAVAISQLMTVDPNTLLSLILAVVALLATSELIARCRQQRRIDESTQKALYLLQAQAGGQLSAEIFFQKKGASSFETLAEEATEIYVVGATLMALTNSYRKILINRLQAGVSVKLAIMTPDPSAVQAASERNGDHRLDSWAMHFNTTRFNIEFMRQNLRDQGKLETRVFPYPPTFQIWMFDPDTPHGNIVVEIYPHLAVETEYSPVFSLKADRDGVWYEYFKKQFEVTWANAENWI
jgi:hypothetical protein